MKVIHAIKRRVKRHRSFNKVAAHAKAILKLWGEHGEETYDDEEIRRVNTEMVGSKHTLRTIFQKYNDEYCSACDGDCCYVIWGGYTAPELAALSLDYRLILNSKMKKQKKDLQWCYDNSKCMYHKADGGCNLPWEAQSVVCVSYLCPIFKNVLSAEDKKDIEHYTKVLRSGLNRLRDLIDVKRREMRLRKLKW